MRSICPLAAAALAAMPTVVPAQTVSVHTVARGIDYPVAVIPGPQGSGTNAGHPLLYVAGRLGAVKLVDSVTGVVQAAPVLNVSQPIYLNGDAGLQCVAVTPSSPASGTKYMYVYYNTTSTTAVLERQTLNATGTATLPGSAQTILRYQRPQGHNGGWLGFSPIDGYLYLSLGDGADAANPDPTNASQSLTGPNVFQGKILRIDPTGDDFSADANKNYRIPPPTRS